MAKEEEGTSKEYKADEENLTRNVGEDGADV